MRQDQVPPPAQTTHSKPWADKNAEEEEKHFGHEERIRDRKGRNSLLVLRNSGVLAVCFMWLFAAVFCAALLVWLAHYLLPDQYLWLSDEQLSKIQAVIFSGSAGALVSAFAQKHMLT